MSQLGGLIGVAILVVAVACAPVSTEAGAPIPGADRPSEPVAATARSTVTTASIPTVAEATPTSRARRSFTMAFTGDLLLHSRVNATAAANAADDEFRDYDYASLLRVISPLIAEVDWAVCHLEVNLSVDNTRLHPYPVFRAPGDVAHDMRRLGYDSCTTASNHILDHGHRGVAETLGVLDDADLRHTGSARNPDEAFDNIWIEPAGVRVANLSYTYGFNGFSVPSDMPWLSNLIDEDRILADAATARAEGAEYVVLSLHWGEQYRSTPSRQQRDLGPRLLASPDIDLIIGHHAHTVQPIDRIDGEWLVYGLGNLLSASTQAIRRDELLVQVTVTETADGTFTTGLQAIPLHLDPVTLTVHRSDPAIRPSDLDPRLAAQLDASWARVIAVLDDGSGWPDLGLD